MWTEYKTMIERTIRLDYVQKSLWNNNPVYVNHIGVDTHPYLIREPKDRVRYRRGVNAVEKDGLGVGGE
jgi:hypothetical protein